MRRRLAFVVVLFSVAAIRNAGAVCGDPGAVALARAQVSSDCVCASPPGHGAYVRCAAGVAEQRAGLGLLPPECRSAVRKCAAHSTCGRPGRVTCCRPTPGSTPRCNVTTPRSCAAKGGCASGLTSCCDACDATGCFTCGASPSCGGTCPGTDTCAPNSEGYSMTFSCGCFPAGATPCGSSGYPQCGGTCLNGYVCQAFRTMSPDLAVSTFCACVDPGATCSGLPECSAGPCPAGAACTVLRVPQFCGCASP